MSFDKHLPPVGSGYLPLDAVECLKKAAATPIPADDPTARKRAIEQAAEWVKATYPQYFKKERTK